MLVSDQAESPPRLVPVASPVKTHDVNRKTPSSQYASLDPVSDRRFLRKRSPRKKTTRLRAAPIACEGEAVVGGVYVPEYGVRIPWGITRDALYRLIPASAFRRSGCWPALRFTLLGVRALYGFDFVTRDGRLSAVRFDGWTPRRRAYRKAAHRLCSALGVPNFVDLSQHGQQVWRYGWVCVEHVAFRKAWRHEHGECIRIAVHEISVWCTE